MAMFIWVCFSKLPEKHTVERFDNSLAQVPLRPWAYLGPGRTWALDHLGTGPTWIHLGPRGLAWAMCTLGPCAPLGPWTHFTLGSFGPVDTVFIVFEYISLVGPYADTK